ncbi:MAG: peptidoglycan DD-metalloendopeptidase family protein [Clostridia bacterium]
MSQKTMKKMAKILAALMIVSVLLGLITPLFASANDTLAELLAAEAQIEKLEAERSEIIKLIAQIEANQEATYQEIELLNQQIEITTSKIIATQVIIDVLSDEIEVEEYNLMLATEKMNLQYESMKTSIRIMYEAGETTYLDILLASESFFDMLSRIEISQQIINHNQNVFDEYTASAIAVENAKQKLEEDKALQEDYKSTLDNEKGSLEHQSNNLELKMKQLMADEQAALTAQAQNLSAEEEMANKVAQLSKELASIGIYVGGEFLWPTPSSYWVTSPFGYRTHPITGVVESFHKGIDIGAAGGQNILSANAGRVIVSDYSSSYGNYVMVDHGGGYVTLYAHMSKRLVSAGEYVGKGDVLGLVGSTGWSTGNHLHFEIILNGEHQNPMNYYS